MKSCSHRHACKYGETIIHGIKIRWTRRIWWCAACGALGLVDDEKRKPHTGEWIAPRKGKP